MVIIKSIPGLCILAVKLSDSMKCKLTLLDNVVKRTLHSKVTNEFNDLNMWGNKILEGKFIWEFKQVHDLLCNRTNTIVYYTGLFLCTNISYLSCLIFRQTNFKFQKSRRKYNKCTWLLFKTVKFASLNSAES